MVVVAIISQVSTCVCAVCVCVSDSLALRGEILYKLWATANASNSVWFRCECCSQHLRDPVVSHQCIRFDQRAIQNNKPPPRAHTPNLYQTRDDRQDRQRLECITTAVPSAVAVFVFVFFFRFPFKFCDLVVCHTWAAILRAQVDAFTIHQPQTYSTTGDLNFLGRRRCMGKSFLDLLTYLMKQLQIALAKPYISLSIWRTSK